MRIDQNARSGRRQTATGWTTHQPMAGISTVELFDGGRRIGIEEPPELSGVLDLLADDPGRTALVTYTAPSQPQVRELGQLLDLHPLLVEDLLKGHQRPKLERHEDTLFVVAEPVLYLDDTEDVDVAEVHVLKRANLIVMLVRPSAHGMIWSGPALNYPPDFLALGSEALLYGILDAVVDSVFPVVRGVQTDLHQIERQVFSGDTAAPERIYRLGREVLDLQQAVAPVSDIIEALRAGFDKHRVADELRAHLGDVADHVRRVDVQISQVRELLTQILTVNATLTDQQRNDNMKAVSSWGAILLVPTLIGSVYGMNFSHMPELDWRYGYPMALGLMVASAVILYIVFKRRDWL
ncbi:magnesium and cobalt transport protein CorA [Propionibacterium australiense]|uniref:Magnesium and cobalt transport protein CorA n=1 Tax=Propionibacterium australiense TaxID=119981 RepID=A0A383S494_9ACTN|nr:magnesium and cobalt transport protein CorA [Propionibacterium australiense]RLP11493.1 magnesium and cobalt transport protein CorA [Propionibacterium australiense]RLP12771.1 magnesium and cobalt transport protein CorA [Propionibacterium australiense]SYZ32194.1 MtCorA-like [Propionibacterium australiense]VEH90707.1 Magnesium transport protein CorA [Propionibacterium australiense]